MAALHYNENSQRPLKEKYALKFPKFKKGDHSVVQMKDDPTFGNS